MKLIAPRGLACVALFVALTAPAPVLRADGFIVVEHPPILPPHPPQPPHPPRPHPPPWRPFMPLEVARHFVDAEVTDTVAITRIDQTFYNPNPQQLEGTYIFPLPDEVAVERFTMWVDGKELAGEVLDADKARQVYESIVSRMRDPALLEYVGQRMFKARVFPIPGHGEVRIKLAYSQTLRADAGLVGYAYPLNTEKFSARPLRELSVRVRVRSRIPMRSVFCPSHEASIDRRGEGEAVVGLEGRDILPDRDFLVYYQVTDEEFGLSVLTHREAGEDGYFMARISPPWRIDESDVLPKDICFVFDTSGSMAGRKIEQARAALKFCLANLAERDRFNVLTFSTEVRPFRDELMGATREAREDAVRMVERLEATGGTNINEALLAAMKMAPRGERERRYLIIFLTDGQPTVGQTDIAAILRNTAGANAEKVRLFAFGLGNDVNTRLLDKLAEENHGVREYVSEQEDLEVKLSNFYAKVASPVLNDLELAFEGARVSDVYPKRLPDLFKGGEVVVLGRYGGEGREPVTLSGWQGERKKSFEYEANFATRDVENDFLPQLWAMRKVGYLLDELRLHGENKELKEEIIRLGKRYGIVTPYTSYLIAEEAREYALRGVPLEGATQAVNVVLDARTAPQLRFTAQSGADWDEVTGEGSVAQSKMNQQLQGAMSLTAGAFDEIRLNYVDAAGQQRVNQIGAQTFYQDGRRWVDSRYDGKAETNKLKTFSKEYFDLLARHPRLNRFFAQGPRVVVVFEGKVYETVDG